jgi:hypothetical protein
MEVFGTVPLRPLTYPPGKRQGAAFIDHVDPQGDAAAAHDAADRKFSATRQGWSKGIGGGDAFMKLCSSSSGCKARLAKGEPAQAGSEPGDGLRNGVGEA